MTTTPPTDPAVSLPTGAESDLWTDAGTRGVYALIGSVPVTKDVLRCPVVTLMAEQNRDGSLGPVDVNVEIDKRHKGLSPTQARDLAELLTAGADLAEHWTNGKTSPATHPGE